MSQLAIRAALEVALQSIVGIIPAVSILSSNGAATSIFSASLPHGLSSGIDVRVANHSTLSSGSYFVVALSATTFSLINKISNLPISVAAGTGGTVSAQLTAWENVGFVPLNFVPYQKVNFVFARPDNVTMGDNFYRERGYMQITLYYPTQKGPYAAMSRAELIRSTFPRGSSFSNTGIVAHIDRTAEIMPGMPTDESYIVIVRVPFYADIIS